MHLSRSHLSAERLNLFGFLIVQCGQTLLRVALRSQQFIKLGVNSLCISVLRALDEKRHQQGRNACNGLPVERLAIEDQPEPDVDANGHNRLRSGQPRSGICQGTIEAGAHAKQRAVESTVPLPYLEQLGKRIGPSAGGSTGATWGVSLGGRYGWANCKLPDWFLEAPRSSKCAPRIHNDTDARSDPSGYSGSCP